MFGKSRYIDFGVDPLVKDATDDRAWSDYVAAISTNIYAWKDCDPAT